TYFGDGKRYNPSSDTWTSLNQVGAPGERMGHTAIWTGSEMIVWGGENNTTVGLNTMGRYSPAANTWITVPPTTTITNPAAGTKIVGLEGIQLGATASDESGSVTQVAFYANGSHVGTAYNAPYTKMWTNNGLGFFT